MPKTSRSAPSHAFDAEQLAAAVRAALSDAGNVREVKMFGGIGFMLNGNLLAGASGRGLLLRIGQDRSGQALAKPGARPMVMRGRTMEDYIYVDPPALNARAVKSWIRLAAAFVQTLPPKKKKKK
jgi:TfoX/Sxy family transcriptional regulator of competence genes